MQVVLQQIGFLLAQGTSGGLGGKLLLPGVIFGGENPDAEHIVPGRQAWNRHPIQ
jgi:hypothetical protein